LVIHLPPYYLTKKYTPGSVRSYGGEMDNLWLVLNGMQCFQNEMLREYGTWPWLGFLIGNGPLSYVVWKKNETQPIQCRYDYEDEGTLWKYLWWLG